MYQVDNIPVIDTITISSKETARSLPSVYQVLPTKFYFNQTSYLNYKQQRIQTTYVAESHENRFTNEVQFRVWNEDEIKSYITSTFNNELYNQSLEFQKIMEEPIGNKVNFHRIIGDAIPTKGMIVFDTYVQYTPNFSGLSTNKLRVISQDINGDGIVPIIGAAPGLVNTWFDSVQHEYMLRNQKILVAIENILEGKTPNLRRYYQRGNSYLKLTLYNKYDEETNPLTESNLLSISSYDSDQSGSICTG